MGNVISIRRLALASAAHPWRTIAAWLAAAVVAIVAVTALLGGSLSSDNHPTDTRESQRAKALIETPQTKPSMTHAWRNYVVHVDRRDRSDHERESVDLRARSGRTNASRQRKYGGRLAYPNPWTK